MTGPYECVSFIANRSAPKCEQTQNFLLNRKRQISIYRCERCLYGSTLQHQNWPMLLRPNLYYLICGWFVFGYFSHGTKVGRKQTQKPTQSRCNLWIFNSWNRKWRRQLVSFWSSWITGDSMFRRTVKHQTDIMTIYLLVAFFFRCFCCLSFAPTQAL